MRTTHASRALSFPNKFEMRRRAEWNRNHRLIFGSGVGRSGLKQELEPPSPFELSRKADIGNECEGGGNLSPHDKKRPIMKAKPSAKPAASKAKPAAAKAAPRPALRFKTIVVPTDFSAASRTALDYAVPLAREHGAKIVLVYVIEPRIYPENILIPPALEPENVALTKQARLSLEKFRAQHVDADVASEAVVALGKPFAEIVSTAKATKADLIVMPTHGFTGLKKILIGSTAERVVSHAPCAVLIVRGV